MGKSIKLTDGRYFDAGSVWDNTQQNNQESINTALYAQQAAQKDINTALFFQST